MAEVLITLAIIGVVAALTIPVVVHKYQQKAFYTQFMKVFNTVSNALALAQAENGNCTIWGTDVYNKTQETNNGIYEENFFPFLRIQRICSSASDCGIPNSLTVNSLNYPQAEEDYSSIFTFNYSYYINPIILNDGSIVQIGLVSSGMSGITFDTNGIKGPNIWGRDIFYIPVIKKNGKNGACVFGTESWLTPEEIEEDCSTTQESDGYYCSLKLIKEGKMNY